jgi:ATP-binding cassette subfamily F protein 3
MEAVEKPTAELPTMVVDFTPDRTTGFEVCQVKNLSKSYGANELFRSFNTTIYQGQCIGILGPNGSGKTTLLKALAGRLEPDTGSTTWGTGVKLGYFSQRLDDFEEQRTVLAEFRAHCELNIPEARQFLAGFLFRGDDVFEEVQNLSGGERNRLQLAKLSVSGANVLLLDEPTNHLDIPSRQALEAALSEFSGTILFITHDRYLLNQLASHIWDLDSSRIEVFHGNYDELKRQRAREARLSSANEKTENREQSAQADGSSEQESEHSRLSTYKLNLLLEQTEERIDELEEEKQEYQEQLANPQTYKQADVGELVNAFDEVKAELERLYDNWVHYKQELDERR